MQLHEDIELVIGDEWQISGTLLGTDDQPLDLVTDNSPLDWILLGPDGARVPGLEAVIIDRILPASTGRLMITLPAALTRTFDPGRYTDAVRASAGGAPAQMWRGIILAAADPFYTSRSS
jgi:hypothetical protein